MKILVSLTISFLFCFTLLAESGANCGEAGSEANTIENGHSAILSMNSFYRRLGGFKEGLTGMPRSLLNFHGISVQNATIGCEYEVHRKNQDGTITYLFTVPAQKIYVVKNGQDICPSMPDIE